MFGVIDCNNFFVSCERVFQPRLRGVPVIVLSNNDGCAIARSNEAKAMGIQMGTPYFRLRHLVAEGRLAVRSGNLALYADMSRRVMSVIGRHVSRMEQYSIDECFIEPTGLSDPAAFGRELSATVLKWTGIPVSVGLAETKTLAKLASKFAKRYPGYHGCCHIATEAQRLKALELTPIGDVWGVGRRMGQSLLAAGVKTALDFSRWDEARVRRRFSMPAVNTLRELRGMPCIALETPAAKQTITSSRSLRQSVSDFETLHSLVAGFTAQVTARLREEGSTAGAVTVYIRTDRFRADLPQRAEAVTVRFATPTDDLRELTRAARQALEAVFLPHYAYKKAAVTLSEITHGYRQRDLFDTVDRERQERIMETLDTIRQRLGPDALRIAAQDAPPDALASHAHRSPLYTTRLSDIITVS